MRRKDALWVMQMCRDRDARSEAEREAFDTAIEALKNESIFTADRPRGEWTNDEHDMPRCSNYGYMPEYNKHIDDYYYSDFCPNCGSDNRGENDYERAIEQMEHDTLYESTYSPEDGSM